jgi:hypothetical protein
MKFRLEGSGLKYSAESQIHQFLGRVIAINETE